MPSVFDPGIFFRRKNNYKHKERILSGIKTSRGVSPQSLQVLASDQGIFIILGYHPYETNGRNILANTGAHSDTLMLQAEIK